MKKEVISTTKTPIIQGAPYSPAIKIGQFLFVSGQTSDNVEADVKTQARHILEKIKMLVESAGTSMDNVVKCTVYLTNLDDYNQFNEVYRNYFKQEPPARACIQVSRLVLGCKVEVEAIAFIYIDALNSVLLHDLVIFLDSMERTINF